MFIRPIHLPIPPGLLNPCQPFIPEQNTTDYLSYVAPRTTGRMSPYVHGRNANGKDADIIVSQALDQMQRDLSVLSAGDTVYLASWMFNPNAKLSIATQKFYTWGELFQALAARGVEIRILMTEFDRATGFHKEIRSYISGLDKLIDGLNPVARRNLQYQVTIQPVTALGRIVGSHHQKFMVIRKSDETIAFCGGIDLAHLRVPADWSNERLAAWHDVHCRLEGLITRQLENEFVMRWNREQGHTFVPSRTDWNGLAILAQGSLKRLDKDPERNGHSLQMHRTVSVNNSQFQPPQRTTRNDIWEAYQKIINCAERYLYLENQYFREFLLADIIGWRAMKTPKLKVILIVPAELDEGSDPITEHGNALQYKFFARLYSSLGSDRLRVYSMVSRFIHSKLIVADDRVMSIGSANANRRGFQLDTEANVTTASTDMVLQFRKRLWSHNLGVSEAIVANWADTEFFSKWDAVALANQKKIQGKLGHARAIALGIVDGECVVPYNYTQHRGKYSYVIPDVLADIDNQAEGSLT